MLLLQGLHSVLLAVFLVCLATATAQPAKAYTDPGSGMILWQALCAGAVGFLFYIRKFIARWFQRKPTDKDIAR